MTPEELALLAQDVEKDDPDTAIVLLVLAGAKLQGTAGDFAALAQAQVNNIRYDEWLNEG